MSTAHPIPDIPDAATPAQTAADAHRIGIADHKTRVIAGAAVGIGSAAIVAALLYANRKPGKHARTARSDTTST